MKWAYQLGFAVADQAAVSGANYLVTIVAARLLSPEAFGQFAVAQTLLLLLHGISTSLIVDPMSVFGARLDGARQKEYLAALTWMTLLFATVVCVLLVGWLVWGVADGDQGMVWCGIFVVPTVLLYLVLKRMYYVQGLVRASALNGVLYASTLTGASLALASLGKMDSAEAPLWTVGFASLVGVLLAARGLGLRGGVLLNSGTRSKLAQLIPRHWSYGRWMLANVALYWMTTGASVPVTAVAGGLGEAGTLRAIQNLFLPFSQSMTAGATFLLPSLARTQTTGGDMELRRTVWRISVVISVAALGYTGLVFGLRSEILDTLYGASHAYGQRDAIIVLLATVQVLSAASYGAALLLRVAERTSSLFLAQAAGAVGAALTAGLLVPLSPITAVAAAQAVASTISLLVIIFAAHRLRTSAIQRTTIA